MKKIILLLFILCGLSYTQVAFRVVAVSPNYPNVYPRYNSLQQVYSAIKDSANVSTGKYFVINIATATENVTDWSGRWKDSIASRNPYMRLTQLGQAIGDSIIGVTTEEFTLLAGILGLKSDIAGDGLSFLSHAIKVNVKYPIIISSDTVTIQLNDSNFVTPIGSTTRNQYVTLKFSTNSGLTYSANGIEVMTQYPIIKRNDSLTIQLNDSNFVIGDATSRSQYVTLKLRDNSLSYTKFGLGVNYTGIDLDSGLIGRSTGLSVNTDGLRLGYNSGKKLTILNTFIGEGIKWIGENSIGISVGQPLEFDSDTNLILGYNTSHFALQTTSNDFSIVVDSGLTTGTNYFNSPKIRKDNNELAFNTSKELETAPTLWGDGLIKSGDAGTVVVNEFAKVENDTVKIKTSYTLQWYDDSLKNSMTYVEPYDSTGLPVLQTGKIKRVTWTYQLSSGNDTVVTNNLDISVNIGDKLRLYWSNGSSRFILQRWVLSTRVWSNLTNISATDFADNKWRLILELYAEAE